MMRHMNYKPGYYLTYFIYCMIPVTIYVWYLWRRRNEDKIEVNDGVEITTFLLLSLLRLIARSLATLNYSLDLH